MLYLIAIFLPFVALFGAGKPFQAILCIVLMLTIVGWPVASLWAILVVNESKSDRRAKKYSVQG